MGITRSGIFQATETRLSPCSILVWVFPYATSSASAPLSFHINSRSSISLSVKWVQWHTTFKLRWDMHYTLSNSVKYTFILLVLDFSLPWRLESLRREDIPLRQSQVEQFTSSWWSKVSPLMGPTCRSSEERRLEGEHPSYLRAGQEPDVLSAPMPAGSQPGEHLGSDIQRHLECAGPALSLDLITYSPSGPASWKDMTMSNNLLLPDHSSH